MESLPKERAACVSSINFAIISKMFLVIHPAVSDSRPPRSSACHLHGTDYEPVAESCRFWIQNSSPAYKIENLFLALQVAVQEIMKEIYKDGLTFKISSKRSTIPLNSIVASSTKPLVCVFEAIPIIKVRHVQISTFKWEIRKKQPTSLAKPLREQVALLAHLARACPCFWWGSTLPWLVT